MNNNFIYSISRKDNPLIVKIGITTNYQNRLRDLKVNRINNLEYCLQTVRDAREIEKSFLDKYKKHRITSTEWFNFPSEEEKTTFINELKKTSGIEIHPEIQPLKPKEKLILPPSSPDVPDPTALIEDSCNGYHESWAQEFYHEEYLPLSIYNPWLKEYFPPEGEGDEFCGCSFDFFEPDGSITSMVFNTYAVNIKKTECLNKNCLDPNCKIHSDNSDKTCALRYGFHETRIYQRWEDYTEELSPEIYKANCQKMTCGWDWEYINRAYVSYNNRHIERDSWWGKVYGCIDLEVCPLGSPDSNIILDRLEILKNIPKENWPLQLHANEQLKKEQGEISCPYGEPEPPPTDEELKETYKRCVEIAKSLPRCTP